MIAGDKKPECEYVYSAEEHRRLTRIADHYPKVVEALKQLVRWQKLLCMENSTDDQLHQWTMDTDAAKDRLAEARRLEDEK